MITDGYWKSELKRTISALKRWQRIARWNISRFALHQVNKQFLYSAVTIRKIIEDERRAAETLKKVTTNLPPFSITHKEILVWKYSYIGDMDCVPEAIWTEDYVLKDSAYPMSLEHICNQIIHSYVWQILYGGKHGVFGIMVASDRYKRESGFLLQLNDWLDALKFCVEHGTV